MAELAEEAADPAGNTARIADTFGGINLEDIKAPECFEIESALVERCQIPVFHDDQHGTAIVTAAGLINALEIQGKRLQDAVITGLGAGNTLTIGPDGAVYLCDYHDKRTAHPDPDASPDAGADTDPADHGGRSLALGRAPRPGPPRE